MKLVGLDNGSLRLSFDCLPNGIRVYNQFKIDFILRAPTFQVSRAAQDNDRSQARTVIIVELDISRQYLRLPFALCRPLLRSTGPILSIPVDAEPPADEGKNVLPPQNGHVKFLRTV